MRQTGTVLRMAVVVVLAALSLGAGQAYRLPEYARVWPPPPEAARVRYLRTLDPVTARGPRSLMSRFFRAVIGANDEPSMSQPYGLAVSPDRRLYVADTGAHAIHVMPLDKNGYSAIAVEADSLIGMAVAGGRVFSTDSTTGRVLCFDHNGHMVWSRGQKDGFRRPTGLAAGPDRLYVVDTLQNRVVVLGLDGRPIGAFGTQGTAAGQFNYPTNVARGADGRVYVTDSMNFRVQVFDADGQFLSMFGHLGDGSGDFNRPKGVSVDSDGHVYVVEGLNDVVQIFDGDGRLLLDFGESGNGPGQFWLPSGIAIVNDIVYVADAANRRVQLFEYVSERRR